MFKLFALGLPIAYLGMYVNDGLLLYYISMILGYCLIKSAVGADESPI